jgi:predicted neutral ceramidase superfamily lipid hydrolase
MIFLLIYAKDRTCIIGRVFQKEPFGKELLSAPMHVMHNAKCIQYIYLIQINKLKTASAYYSKLIDATLSLFTVFTIKFVCCEFIDVLLNLLLIGTFLQHFVLIIKNASVRTNGISQSP